MHCYKYFSYACTLYVDYIVHYISYLVAVINAKNRMKHCNWPCTLYMYMYIVHVHDISRCIVYTVYNYNACI